MGSIYAAFASFLEARSRRGRWFLRIDDLDRGREVPGAAEGIVRDLSHFGLQWDGSIQWQSKRLKVYQDALRYLDGQNLLYSCTCSRKRLSALAGGRAQAPYPGFCRRANQPRSKPHALRVIADQADIEFYDRQQGLIRQNVAREIGDFVVQRRDTICAYQLSVVLDDNNLGITEVLRGIDLLDSTPRQIFLQRLLRLPTPAYSHIPIIVDRFGSKLSKQSHAKPIADENPSQLLFRLLIFLNQYPPGELARCSREQVIEWAITNWDARKIPKGNQTPNNEN